ncbi:TetR/AcrR family transcriptional regulator [Kineosporia sp. J2-2]|uniref:TetR/AcrR family transcriptional regulator n=1 Tax=Kineosporia corallincola TaxID=2835133 RepID=A0ABS5TC57_9ACTN|nr:TetR/AcrR family transcriptional regulator [Kineosporia corallincola]MBT0768621.1 TetR/AcrR family transcriptional regulator [Kineosporia corallincola]
MSEEQLDPRVVRTRRMLHDAMRELLHDRDPVDISVTDITARAKVSRPTFYQHCGTPEELIATMVRDDLRDIIACGRRADDGDPLSRIRQIVGELNQRRCLYRRLMSHGPGLGRGKQELLAYLAGRTEEMIMARHPDLPARTAQEASRFIAGGMIVLLSGWLSSADPAPEPEVDQFCRRLWRLGESVVEGLAEA